MTHWIIGVDSSNGVQNFSALKQKKDGSFQRRKDISLTSVRATVSTGTLDTGVGETEFDYYQWHDILYTAGDTALEHARGTVMPVSGRSRYGGEAQLFMIAVAFYELGMKDGDTADICLLAPPGDSSSAGDKYRDGIARFGNELEISKNGGKKRTFHITGVTVFLETVAAAFACQYDDEGTFQPKNPMNNAVMLIDGGRITLDRLIFRHGKIDKTTISSATNDRLGIGSMVLRPVATWIREHLPSVYHDGAEELADRAIRNPKLNSNGVPTYRVSRMGEPPRNVTTPVMQALANYHSNVRRFIDAERIEANVMRVLLIGGIEPLIGDRLHADYDGNLEFATLRDYDHLKKVEATYLNSVGAMRYLVKKHLAAK